MAYKDEQKALKAPDEFQKLGQEALPFFEKHQRPIIIGVAAVLGLGLVIAIVAQVSARSNLEASREFGGALKVLERPVSATAPTDAKPGDEPPFKTEAEKDEAIIKSLSDFRAKRSGTPAAVSAALPLAQAKLRQGKPEEAMPLVEEYLAKSDANDTLRPAAFEAKGYAFEAEKKYDEALKAFDELAGQNKTDFMKGMGLYHHARILQIKGDTAGAAKVYSEIDAAAPNTAASRLAKERIALLTSQGVDVPKPAPVAVTIDAGT